MSTVPVKKATAGRPKKNKSTADSVKKEGIVKSPTDEEHIAEVFLTTPTIFKKMLKLYDDYSASEIMLSFGQKGMLFQSHIKKEDALIITKIYGKDINRYYCEKPIECFVSCQELCKISNYIEPEYDYEFMLSIKKDSRGYTICIDINNKSLENIENIEINDIKSKEKFDPPLFTNDELDYPIALKFNSKSIKRKFSAISTDFNSKARFISNPSAKTVSISATSKEITISYAGEFKSIRKENILGEDETSVEIDLTSFKSFLKNAVDEHTMIYIARDKTICMKAEFGRVKAKGDVIGYTKLYKWIPSL